MNGKYAGMSFKDYSIIVLCRAYEDGNRTMFCPICGVEYDNYLLCIDGCIGCKYCMGKQGIEIIENMIKQNTQVLVDGCIKDLTIELVKSLGLVPKI